MKRSHLLKHLRKHGCILLREGANHAIYQNLVNGQQSAVGRHRELADLLCKKVCQQLGTISKIAFSLSQKDAS